MEQNYTYILLCADNTLYTGWTTNLKRRLAPTMPALEQKYTRPRRPVHLVYCEVFDSKTEAMRREWEIKQLSRKAKLLLIAFNP